MEQEKEQKIIVVTGGAGFIGSHLCEHLVRGSHRVISLDNYFTGSKENHVAGVEYREGHTKDIEVLVPEAPDLVYHLGEYSRVEKSFEDVETLWDFNMLGTFAVLEFCRKRGSKIVYAGSSTKFGDDGLGRDQSPYAWVKASNTELVKNYGAWFGISYAITYFYNVYGPRERGSGPYATLVGIFKEEHAGGQPLTIVAPGTQTRNFTHVLDIIAGLVLVGEQGTGDGFGIGNDRAYSVLEVAKLFGGETVLLPERQGNRQSSMADSAKVRALGWQADRPLEQEIKTFVAQMPRGQVRPEKRVLVFSTTFHPVAGPAENALCALMASMPDIQFDIVTSAHTKEAFGAVCPVANGEVHRVGWGTRFDKYFLPIAGFRRARALEREHQYLFVWSLMASYGALAAALLKSKSTTPLLITLADQHLGGIPWHTRALLRFVLGKADQVYAAPGEQERQIRSLAARASAQKSLGQSDAFANAIRFAYAGFLRKELEEGK